MLSVFYGTDRGAARDAATQYLEKNGMEAGSLRTVSADEFEEGRLAEMIGAQSLFGGTEYFLLDTPSKDEAFLTEVQGNVKELAASSNVFVVLEDALLAPARKKYEKGVEILEEFTAQKPERFNTFTMADALAKKDKRNLWVLLQQAKAAGLRPEEITGMLWWQLKTLRLAALTNSAEEAEMKEYPYKKAKSALRNFKEGEVHTLSLSLITLYHDAHKGLGDMEVKLEQWVLSI